MLTFLKKFLSLKPRQVPESTVEAPYKVEAPASAVAVKPPVTCGCGRSTTGECVGLHALTADQWAVSDKNPNRVVAAPVEAAPVEAAPVETAPVVAKKPAAKKKTAAKPVVKEKPGFLQSAEDKIEAKVAKPRAPRKPKTSV